MTRKKKKKILPPRRKRMKRAARLQAAPAWLTRYSGKNVVRSYARWFGVDLGCSLVELQLLGVDLDPDYVTALRRTLAGRRRPCRADRGEEEAAGESDEWYAYIAGYTPNGLSFGITWEEWQSGEGRGDRRSVTERAFDYLRRSTALLELVALRRLELISKKRAGAALVRDARIRGESAGRLWRVSVHRGAHGDSFQVGAIEAAPSSRPARPIVGPPTR